MNCLRCQSSNTKYSTSKGNRTYGECLECQAYFSTKGWWVYVKDFIKPDDQMNWYLTHKSCAYYPPNSEVSSQDLPLFPLDITPEQLKIYLVFG